MGNMNIQEIKDAIAKSPLGFAYDAHDEQTDEVKHFYFQGTFEGREVIFDTVMYTLQTHYNSELYERVEEEAARKFPKLQSLPEDGGGDLDEEVGIYMAEVMAELEEEEAIKVQEHVDIFSDNPLGIGLDVGLNHKTIGDPEVTTFIREFLDDSLKLDETYYTFESDDD